MQTETSPVFKGTGQHTQTSPLREEQTRDEAEIYKALRKLIEEY
jgi:hypothetical protein